MADFRRAPCKTRKRRKAGGLTQVAWQQAVYGQSSKAKSDARSRPAKAEWRKAFVATESGKDYCRKKAGEYYARYAEEVKLKAKQSYEKRKVQIQARRKLLREAKRTGVPCPAVWRGRRTKAEEAATRKAEEAAARRREARKRPRAC